jgi:hypothetical protein
MSDPGLTTEQWVENLRAAVLDVYKQLDAVNGRLDSQYIRIKRLEGDPIDAAPLDEAARGPLVERVARAIGNEPFNTSDEARAAIREVAAWLREEGYPSSPARLEREASS